jgi:multiple sugar transport system substrate-binding protein
VRLSSEDTRGGGQRVTLYGANEVGFAEAIAACNKQAGGRYSISYVVLPRTADAQRELMARRLAAEMDAAAPRPGHRSQEP